MSFVNQLLERFFPTPHRLQPGVYHYQAPLEDPMNYRLHLRIENDGQGILIVNASTVLHLNQTAAEYAYHIVKQTPEDQAAEQVARRYNVGKEEARRDFHEMKEKIDLMITTPDLDPVSFFGIDRQEPYSGDISAPYRMDAAITYQVMESAGEQVAPLDRVKRELTTEEWKTILDKAWNAGIPHAIFTGGEPTLRTDLVELIVYAETLGMVTGILTNGDRLSEIEYLNQLLQSGLDHVMILLDPADEAAWEGLRDILVQDIHTTVHLTITSDNTVEVEKLLARLSEMGVTSVSLSTTDLSLKDALETTRTLAADLGLSLVWDVPVPYSSNNPVALELVSSEVPPKGAGQAWVYVEPDGDVLPAQGVNKVMGNLLTDPWDSIWQNRE